MKRKAFKILLFVALAALYLNIGWTLGTYYHNHVLYNAPETIAQTIAKGAGSFLSPSDISSLLYDQLLLMFVWPFITVLVAGSWILAGLFYVGYYLLWLVFGGGIAKLLGVG